MFGGSSVFAQPLFVGRPSVGDRSRFFERLSQVLDRQWLTNNGPLVREFEGRIAEVAGVEHCVAVCNATAALQLLHRALGVRGEIIMPSMTYVATAHSARMAGLTPVFCDVDPLTGCLDPAAVESALSERTSAVLGVHLWGQPCAVEDLTKVADRHRLTLTFDAAHALGCTEQGRPIGGFGEAEVFSFHATKVVNSFEGGAVVTGNAALADELRALRAFGAADGAIRSVGTNAKLSEAGAAMGLTSLEAFPATVRHNRANLKAYRTELDALPGVRVLPFDESASANCQYAVALIDAEVTGVHRDLLVRALAAENVIAQKYFSPACHQLEPYAGAVRLPNTERLAEQVIALPTGPATSVEQVRLVGELLRYLVSHGPELSARVGR
nr:aminotransferase class I/II-fold pyridoxal phosphate-dependent enzyme [Kineosporia babensis]